MSLNPIPTLKIKLLPSLKPTLLPTLKIKLLPSLKPTLFLFLFLFLFPLLSFSQTLRTIKVGSYYVIQDSTAALRRDCLFCDPATMPDRIVLDSNHRMIARRTSNPFGYTYYEWKDANYEKSMEQITYKPFIMAYTHFYKNGSRIDTAENTTTFDINISYYRNSFQKANPYHGTWTANYIHVKLPSSATDSLIRLYPYLKAYAKNQAEFWRVLNLQESGNIQSNGLIMYAYDSSKQSMGIKPIKKKYKIGQWRYYNLAGKLQKIENNVLAVPMQ